MTSTMYDRDSVISHAAACARVHSLGVKTALVEFLADATDKSTRALRDALVAQAAGFEDVVGNGGTYDGRVATARAALEAWNGPTEVVIPADIAGQTISCSKATAQAAGFELSTDGTVRVGVHVSAERLREWILVALSEGRSGELVMRCVVATRHRDRDMQRMADITKVDLDAARAQRSAAGMTLAAEREITRRGGR